MVQCPKCNRVFKSAHGLLIHQSVGAENCNEAQAALAHTDQAMSLSNQLHSDLRRLSLLEEPEPASELTKAEVSHLVQMRQRCDGVSVCAMKKAITEGNKLRAEAVVPEVQAVVRQILDEQCTPGLGLDKIAELIQEGFRPWKQIPTLHREATMCSRLYPSVKPKMRDLSEYPIVVADDDSDDDEQGENLGHKKPVCADIPVEETLQMMWQANPSLHDAMMAYSELQCRKKSAILERKQQDPGADWEIDDYHTAIFGLKDEQLGVDPRLVPFVVYADGIDHVNSIGAFAGKQKVVVTLTHCLMLPPADRVQLENIFVVNVCFEKVAKRVGYNALLGGDPANVDCSSFGGSLRRWQHGLLFTVRGQPELHKGNTCRVCVCVCP